MMNPEWKAKWLEALRSGKYKQGRKTLRVYQDEYGAPVEPRFCCLGVLADIQQCGWVGSAPLSQRVNEDDEGEGDHNEELFLFDELAQGLDTTTQRVLSNRNDGTDEWCGKPQSFAEIADHIEANL